ncbi:hypothetical protein [Streptomyces sp.]|uniref:hypothetical protein n=1 Tax=Streptomyces sp. TaxID=1931 RepID=UPI002D77458F|nr:hypothetical protein [Streptomyces sp.]HET6354174.1 hypothetical protein [Streptomyces sp.]
MGEGAANCRQELVWGGVGQQGFQGMVEALGFLTGVAGQGTVDGLLEEDAW